MTLSARDAPAASSARVVDSTGRPPLRRARTCAVAGVSSGLAAHLGVSVTAIRVLFVLLSLLGGAGVVLYAWFWAFVPWAQGREVPSRSVPVASIALVVAAAGLVTLLVASTQYQAGQWGDDTLGPRLALGFVVALLAATVCGVWAGFIDRNDPARGPRHARWTRTVAVVILVVVLFSAGSIESAPWVRLVAVLLPLLAIAAVVSPALVQRWRELSGERVKLIREEQRSEMAAHLHDSVLQTLALIQNRAGASSEAARLARAQERELRSWLYDGDQPADSDLPTDLRDYAGALELDYPVRIEVVAAGSSTERASGEVAAAAREAMLNAARHAGGEVSVYIEGSPRGVDVYVRDRGAGFDPDAVPADRLGVRQSVIGRMRRAGGAASVRSDGSGTEVHLRYREGPRGEGDGRG